MKALIKHTSQEKSITNLKLQIRMSQSGKESKVEQEQAAIASGQWKVMRRTVKERKVKRDAQAGKWFRTIYSSMTEDIVEKLD